MVAEVALATATSIATSQLPLKVEDVHVYARDKELLKGINVAFPARQVSAVIGPTGCGKTTLLRAFNRLHDVAGDLRVTGRILLDGEDIYRSEGVRDIRRRIGMVFQRPNPFPQTILENLMIGPRIHGLAHGRQLVEGAENLLREVGLWQAVKDRLKSSPFALSGGQQQLLCLARALSVQPEVLLLDEPTSALDPNMTAHIEGLVRKLSERVTVVMVSHNLGQVSRVADRVLFLLGGEVVEFADAKQFFAHAADPRSRNYIAGEVGAA